MRLETVNNCGSEENMRHLLQTIYRPAAASSQFKKRLLERLTHDLVGEAKSSAQPLLKQLRLWVAIAAALILTVIGYGVWLPQSLESDLVALAASPTSLVPPTETSSSDGDSNSTSRVG